MAAAKYTRYYTYIKPVIENPIVKTTAPYVFSILTITIFVLFAIRPTISTILSLQKQLENNQKILASLNKKSQDLATGRKNLESLGPNVKIAIGNAIPSQTDIPSLIRNLQTASVSSISAIQIQPLTLIESSSKPKKSLSLGEVDFSYNIQGSYPEIMSALDKLFNSPRLINIGSIIIGKQEGGALNLAITGKAYYTK